MALTDKLTAIANAIRAKTGGTGTMTLEEMPSEIESIHTGGTPSGSVILTEERTYDVTYKAQAVVDFSATRANLAEAVTAKGVDTLPTSSFDTITTNIGLIEGGGGGGGLQKIGTATTDASAGTGFGQISIPANNGIFLLTNVSVTPDNTNRLPWAMIAWIDTTSPAQTGVALQFNYGCYAFNTNTIRQINGVLQIDGISAYRFNISATYDIYKLY